MAHNADKVFSGFVAHDCARSASAIHFKKKGEAIIELLLPQAGHVLNMYLPRADTALVALLTAC